MSVLEKLVRGNTLNKKNETTKLFAKMFKKMMKTLETHKNKKRTSKSSTQRWSKDSEKKLKRNK